MKHWIAILLTVAVGLATASPATAAKKPTRGVVVKTGGGELVVDLGRSDGVRPDGEVWVYRRLVVTHPVTGKDIEDKFPIGVLRLDEVGDRLSIARDWSTLSRTPKPGDYVVMEPPSPPKPRAEEKPAVADEQKSAPESEAVERAFRETLGRSIPDRIEVWQRFLVENPDSPWVDRAKNELHWLRVTLSQQRARREAVRQGVAAPEPEDRGLDATATAPPAVHSGMPIELTTVVDDPKRVDRVRLHVRPIGRPTYETYEMKRSGDYGWRASLDSTKWDADQKIEYFAEVIRDDGQVEQIDPASSPVIDVRRAPQDPIEQGGRSEATMLAEYVDFKAGEGRDEFFRFEARYRYDLQIPLLTAFAAGVGSFRGTGGSLEEIEAGETDAMLLNYGFAETEFEFVPFFGLNTRLLIGNNQRLGSDSRFRDAFGASGELRFGQTDGTKLLVGAAFTRTLGAEAWLTLDIEAIEKVPMTGEAVVTNLPVGAELGVSLNYGAGYEFTDWFTLMGRVGWNARTIYDHGPTAGLATVFNW